ncbi:hypothetical protein [Photobacterium lipolyticum]|uniref:Uncharacterized protein n=1 Tax=Photobacterium lipolyticum TaxID=266810 RepID=A0A2T3N300_9GAMM|nr:hypothetical protein [Photobacterium lipolyticum]PSW06733.1 hypothetical protein C9I89_04145 [Photobacterium lipolyticum]
MNKLIRILPIFFSLHLFIVVPLAHAAWTNVLSMILQESLTEFSRDSSKELAKVFVSKVNEWLSDEKGESTEIINGGDIKDIDGESSRVWEIKSGILTNEEIKELEKHIKSLDGNRRQIIIENSNTDTTIQEMKNSTGGAQVKGNDNKIDIKVNKY